MHRIGGIEKQDGTGNVNYDPDNHERMVHLRADKVAGHRQATSPTSRSTIPTAPSCSCSAGGAPGVWPSRRSARRAAPARRSAHAHLVHMNPFPANLGEVLAKYPKVLIPEMNLGQLAQLVRAEFLVDAKSLTKVQGLPFRAAEIEAAILEMI